jgi:hypothetical protein
MQITAEKSRLPKRHVLPSRTATLCSWAATSIYNN